MEIYIHSLCAHIRQQLQEKTKMFYYFIVTEHAVFLAFSEAQFSAGYMVSKDFSNHLESLWCVETE